jgi:4-alpha-glucanotransferase
MRLGLYLDLAVGPRLGGAETWVAGSPLVTGAALGAPADALSPTGQHWGIAPLSPTLCRAQGYTGFSQLLRAVMRHAGMIRIDHVIGLMRSFWIPEGAEQGAYVSHPMQSLLAVVAIESARSGTVVVGEDLGLVPEGLRDALDGAGLYGMEVLQFMRTKEGDFTDTARIRKRAICAFATHDTPTIAGFLAAEDVRLHAKIGSMSAEVKSRIEADRAAAKACLNGADPVPDIHRRLARSNCEMVAVQLDDIAGQLDQQNLPGTVHEHPNWRRQAPLSVGDIATSVPLAALGAEMAAAGRANPNRNGEGQ